MNTFDTITAEEFHEKLQNIKNGAVGAVYSLERCREIVPIINSINRLKKEKDTVILAHSYVTPDILYGVADFTGDSYSLSKDAVSATQKTILFAAVKFMGETAKILNPSKNVIVPGSDPACSLADSITSDNIKELKKQYPGYAVMCYINTSAEVKAECDVCVTSSNVYKIIENYPSDKIIFVPDKLMGENIIAYLKKNNIKKDIVIFDGSCYVHEEFSTDSIAAVRGNNPDVVIVSHPECKPEVVDNSDFTGSTGQIIDYVKRTDFKKYMILSECGLGSRLEAEYPGKAFIGTCRLCKYMKSNTLENIYESLLAPREEQCIRISNDTLVKASICVQNMFRYNV